MLDLLIRRATLMDGTGRPAYVADIAITQDRITEIGEIAPNAQAEQVIDATGLVAAPGFIDIHTHADIALMARPDHLPKVMQGVTTEVFTNCGLGFAPVTDRGLAIQKDYITGLFGDDGNSNPDPDAPRADWTWRTVADFLAHYEKQGIATNIAYLVPHGSLRVSAMGMEERPATKEELAQMIQMLEQGLEEGAWGMSTGIWYAPMRSAEREELVSLCRASGFFATHQRDYGEQIEASTLETLAIAEEAGVPVQIAHFQLNGPTNAGRAPQMLEVLARARAKGIDVTCDTYPYTAGSTFVQSMLPAWAVDGGPEQILRRLADPQSRNRMRDELASRPTDWSRYALVGAESTANAPYEGMSFDTIAKKRGMTEPEWVCALLEEDNLRACFVHHGAHEENVRTILQWEHQMVGSDGLHLPGKTHPRLYGTFPRILGYYAREQKVISLETAVHKMTLAPAQRLGLERRGKLAQGYFADLVLFDPESVRDVATFEDPLRYPTGIDWVFVNGKPAKLAGNPTHSLAGKVLRRTTKHA
jgi:N-acyl-D-amino-acid deacylase